MKIVSLAEVKAKLSAYVHEAKTGGPVVITRNGEAVAVLVVPTDDDDLERLLLSRSARFLELLGRSREKIQAGRGVGHEAFWKAVEVGEPAPALEARSPGDAVSRRSPPQTGRARNRTPKGARRK